MNTQANNTICIPLGANSWITTGSSGTIEDCGLTNWSNSDTIFSTYVCVRQPSVLHFSIHVNVPSGSSQLKISAAGQSEIIDVNESSSEEIDVGDFSISNPGYVKIDFQGLTKTGDFYAEIYKLYISGIISNEEIHFIDSDVYWGRRGPSVHLCYDVPDGINVEWFYNEVTVPSGNDAVGSYFMANGFNGGYFGIQVNSTIERRVLFSVWNAEDNDDDPISTTSNFEDNGDPCTCTSNPEDNDNSSTTSDSLKVKTLLKGEDVLVREFGHEGSGIQCILFYNWGANITYKFLTRAQPDGNNNTIYTSWFYATEKEKWLLMASLKRPNTNTYLEGLHSFLENFETETGDKRRKAYYGNQWVADANGIWYEVTEATFTGDNTACNKCRMDFAGGVKDNQFFLSNCGFFNECVPLDSSFSRKRKDPTINFDCLPYVNHPE